AEPTLRNRAQMPQFMVALSKCVRILKEPHMIEYLPSAATQFSSGICQWRAKLDAATQSVLAFRDTSHEGNRNG
ncbi:MAG: hypothetical protein ACLQMF_12285, partial [Rectinemataceae bacterium]